MPDETHDDDQLFELLRKTGLKASQAQTAKRLISEMASASVIEKFESQIRILTAKMEAGQKEAQAKFNLLLWFIGIGVALLIASNFFAP